MATTNTTKTLTVEAQTFYDRTLLERLTPNLVFAKYGQEKTLPKREGDKVNFRRFNSYEPATTALTEGVTPQGKTVSITEVIAIVVADRPGSLSAALTALADEQVSVEYMYAFTSRESGTANVILRVDNNDKALSVLEKKGIKTLTSQDICEE